MAASANSPKPSAATSQSVGASNVNAPKKLSEERLNEIKKRFSSSSASTAATSSKGGAQGSSTTDDLHNKKPAKLGGRFMEAEDAPNASEKQKKRAEEIRKLSLSSKTKSNLNNQLRGAHTTDDLHNKTPAKRGGIHKEAEDVYDASKPRLFIVNAVAEIKKEDGQVETINVLTNKEMLLKVSSHPNVLEIKRQVFAQAEKDNLFPAAGMWDSTIMDNREVENEKQIDDDVRLITIRYDLTKESKEAAIISDFMRRKG
eukprot:GHVT01010320.1.p1 GENE.GHVT01010320.1~~GHVT01010320.1.p1  ORF type:complete len:258 (+),score=40.84 GHVT01010320.1:1363-2136(+)